MSEYLQIAAAVLGLIVLTEIYGRLYVRYFWHKPERRRKEIERQNAVLDRIEFYK